MVDHRLKNATTSHAASVLALVDALRAAVETGLAVLVIASAQLDGATAALKDALRPYVTAQVTQEPITR